MMHFLALRKVIREWKDDGKEEGPRLLFECIDRALERESRLFSGFSIFKNNCYTTPRMVALCTCLNVLCSLSRNPYEYKEFNQGSGLTARATVIIMKTDWSHESSTYIAEM